MTEKDGTRWGNWTYDKSRLVLELNLTMPDGDELWYEVDLASCTNGSQILDWILQVDETQWVPVEDVGHLVRALAEVLGPGLQGEVCPGGKNKTFDAVSFLLA